MTINDILAAKESLAKLNAVKFNSFETTLKVYKLNTAVNAVIDVAVREQNKIIDIYAKKDEQGNPIIEQGSYTFPNEENQTKCITEINKLRNSEITDISKVTISLEHISLAKDITTQDLLQLECLIDWK